MHLPMQKGTCQYKLSSHFNNSYRTAQLYDLLTDYHTWNAYNAMDMNDELIVAFGYILPHVPLNM